MNREELLEKIIEILCENIDVQEVNEESSFLDDLEMASIEVFAFVGDLEAELEIVIPEKFLSRAATVGELTDAVLELL